MKVYANRLLNKLGTREKLFEKYSQFEARTKPIIIKTISGPIKVILNIKMNWSMLFVPRYSARNFVPAVPK